MKLLGLSNYVMTLCNIFQVCSNANDYISEIPNFRIAIIDN